MGRNARESGEGAKARGNEGRKGSRSGDEGGEGGAKGKARIGKRVLFCEKGSAEQKTGVVPRKIARNRVQNGEKQEKGRFWDEKNGVG